MLVLAAVPDVQLHKLRRAAGLRFHLAHARTWDDALTTIRTRPVELAVVDPLLGGTPSGTEISRLSVLFPSLPLALYTTLSPAVAAVLLALGQSGIHHVVFARYDDHPARLREVLAAEEARSTSHRLREQLGWMLAPLPSELRWALEEVLRSPRHFLAAARVLHAHRLLQDPGFTVDDVAQRLGYAQTKTLQLHARAYLGLTLGEMRDALDAQEALQRVAHGFAPQAARASAS